MHQRILRLDWLLDLEQQLTLLPHLCRLWQDLRSDHLVRVVRKARPDPSSGLDQHLRPERNQLLRAGWRESHPPFGLLDLLHDTDSHSVTS